MPSSYKGYSLKSLKQKNYSKLWFFDSKINQDPRFFLRELWTWELQCIWDAAWAYAGHIFTEVVMAMNNERELKNYHIKAGTSSKQIYHTPKVNH